MAPERIAVVDLGTNSTRLLVADVSAAEVSELERRTTVTRLGEGVDGSGRISDAAAERVLEALHGYRDAIDALEARRVVAVATSAVRDAENGPGLLARIAERTALEVRMISGEEEAALTFLGATAARGEASEAETLVIDIGGGSTELVVGRAGSEPLFHASTDMGVVRHSERHITRDPPPREEIATLAREAGATVIAAVPEEVRSSVDTGIAVAGTPTSLAAVDQRLDPYDPARVQGYRLSRAAASRMLDELAALALSERREVPGLHPDRAPTIVAGTAILLECMEAFGLDEVEVSEADLLHGAALRGVNQG